jgi:hypothetical protein
LAIQDDSVRESVQLILKWHSVISYWLNILTLYLEPVYKEAMFYKLKFGGGSYFIV